MPNDRAVERVDRLAAVEVADPPDPGVVVVRAVGVRAGIVPTGMCSKTGKVPSAVGAAGTPVLPGDVRIDVAAVPEVSDCGSFRWTYT